MGESAQSTQLICAISWHSLWTRRPEWAAENGRLDQMRRKAFISSFFFKFFFLIFKLFQMRLKRCRRTHHNSKNNERVLASCGRVNRSWAPERPGLRHWVVFTLASTRMNRTLTSFQCCEGSPLDDAAESHSIREELEPLRWKNFFPFEINYSTA